MRSASLAAACLYLAAFARSIPVIPSDQSVQPHNHARSVDKATVPRHVSSLTPITSIEPRNGNGSSSSAQRKCGVIQQYFNPTPLQWRNAHTSTWLNIWWEENYASFAQNGGFAGTLGTTFLGDPNFNCKDDGSTSNCDFDACSQMNSSDAAGSDLQQAYYVVQSTNRLHSYFVGLGQALSTSAIGAAMNTPNWAYTFYVDKDVEDITLLKELYNIAITLVAVGAAFAMGPVAASVAAVVAISATSNMFIGGIGAALYATKTHTDNTPQRAAEVGSRLSYLFTESMKELINANNLLMNGSRYGDSGDIRSYLEDGAFVNFQGVDKVSLIDTMSAMLMSTAINYLWKNQKVFIMGGGPCDDSGGIGTGPQEAKICRDGKAWYLYWWKEYSGIQFSRAKKWGHTEKPPGFDELGKGVYAGITVEHIINSSLDAYNSAGYAYTATMARNRAEAAIKNGEKNPAEFGAGWEGIFTIPVCDVGSMVMDAKTKRKEHILKPYGSAHTPQWCGPICSNNPAQYIEFIKAARMEGFQSPTVFCRDN
ncbi:MAG: hypothetical protein M1817_002605 [Caeruleum heppii]|nr:MAG: hypothetical protein M1817_002605 [Caeruleum heppii]